jgi:adenosylcobyric acid synthase
VAIVHLPHISNFTDFNILSTERSVSVRYVKRASELEGADIILLPGTKNTIEDLIDLRNRGMDAAIVRHARRGGMVVGICGGYQMLGSRLMDPCHVESRAPEAAGLGLLDMEVTFEPEKRTAQSSGTVNCRDGWMSELNGLILDGYEIHAGHNRLGPEAVPWLTILLTMSGAVLSVRLSFV